MKDPVKLLRWAAGLSILAGSVHGALTDAHFQESWVLGVLFMLAAMGQGLYGFAILASEVLNGAPITTRWPARARLTFYALGIGCNAVLVLAYLASRTVGLGSGAEPWDALGIFTKLVETAIIALLATLFALTFRAHPESTRPPAPHDGA